jgi:hypothetical protein
LGITNWSLFMKIAILVIALAASLTGCAIVPYGPYGAYGPAVVVSPGYYGHGHYGRGHYGR